MRSESVGARVERALAEAVEARAEGRVEEALSRLTAASALVSAGPVRRELRVELLRQRGLCHVLTEEVDRARDALNEALFQAGSDGALADPVRADLAVLDLTEGDGRRAKRRIAERGRDRRAGLVAQARIHLWEGADGQAEQAVEACEQAPGGAVTLGPPSAALRALVAIWQGRPQQARLLYEGVAQEGNPWWELVKLLVLRSLWVQSGDARYLQLALGVAEQLRFDPPRPQLPGLAAMAASQHAAILSFMGQGFLAGHAAEEALALLGDLTLPEWPRAAILHDLAMVFRDCGRDAQWQAAVDLWGQQEHARWRDRMRLVSGPRARWAVDPPSAAGGRQAASSVLTEVALGVLENRKLAGGPESAFLRGLTEQLGAHGGRWVDSQTRGIARTGTALPELDMSDVEHDAPRVRLALPSGESVWLEGIREGAVAHLDADLVGRLADAARALAKQRARESELRNALELAEARKREAVQALERARRGAAAAVVGGRFPSVAGRSTALRKGLDRLGLLAELELPVLVEGPTGSGRRHLARALDAHLDGAPERCPIVDMALVPREAMKSTLLRLEAEGVGGCHVVANAEHLSPEAVSWLIERSQSGEGKSRLILTLDADDESPIAERLRAAFRVSRVEIPGLDERLEDLPMLIDAVLQSLGRRPKDLGTAARAVLARRAWPGHVAELRAVLTAANVRSGGKTILPEHLEANPDEEEALLLSEGLDLGYHDAIKSYRQRLLRHALVTTGGNRTRAAALLGMQRTYFMRLIKDLGADDIRPEG